MGAAIRADLVLVGGGHAHVQVLRRWMMAPVAGVRLTVVLDRPEAVYSGMVPGFVAGDYALAELEIDVLPLARRALARVVLAPALAVDARARRVVVDGRPPLPYDVASLDVGSTVRGLELPGVRPHALATRPIRGFVDRLDVRLAEVGASGGGPRVVIVGAGAAGVELGFTLDARLRARGTVPVVTVLSEEASVLPGYSRRARDGVVREAADRGIALRTGARVRAVEADAVLLDGERLPSDLVVWATGAAPPPLVVASALPTDPDGFLRVRRTLQVVGHDDLFAAGDCAAIDDAPWVRKAGVYAVRAGPVLDRNLRFRLRGRTPAAFRPQRRFLSLLNLGGRRALAEKWGLTATGHWVWRWKNRIDRRFMRRFQVLAADGGIAATFPTPEAMGMQEMPCGGCAAKVGPAILERALSRLPPAPADPSVLVGLSAPDDVAAVVLSHGDTVLATVDAFRAFTDDPWLVGHVAAVNAASDVLAKGGHPRHALALVTVAEEEAARAEETLHQVLAGVRAALDPLGVALVGGHSTQGPELFVGLTILGEPAGVEPVIGLGGAAPGDAIISTKPLGTGVILAADMQGRAAGRWVAAAIASMARPNVAAAAIARAAHARASTDVSGFGLVGHLTSILRASRVSARVALDAVPALDGARALLARGVRSSFHAQNAALRRGILVDAPLAADPSLDLLFDPQTSGGLLLVVSGEQADGAIAALRDAGDERAAVIGFVEPARAEGTIVHVTRVAGLQPVRQHVQDAGAAGT